MNKSLVPVDSNMIYHRILTTLNILGFDAKTKEKKYKIAFSNKDLFSVLNKTAFEIIIHFLFYKLSPERTSDLFKDCWPVEDKKQDKEFRTVCFDWLEDIRKNDADSRIPQVSKTVLMSPTGPKFLQFLFYFAEYVLRKSILMMNGKPSILLQPPAVEKKMQKFSKVQSQILFCACEDKKQKLMKQTQAVNNAHKEWRNYASQLIKELRSREKNIKDLENIKHDQIKLVASHSGIRQMLTSVTDCTENLHTDKNCSKARKLWSRLEKINSNSYKSLRHLATENTGEPVIDADELNIQVPSIILDNAEDELRKAKVEQIFENGKLNIVNFLKLSNISMSLLGKKLSQVPFHSLSKELNTLELSQRSKFGDISNLMDLKNNLEKLCSDHSENVSQLLSEGFSSTPSGSNVKRRTKYTLAPPTPPISFEPFEGPTPEDARFLRKSLGNRNRNGETPEMAEAILRKLETKAKPAANKKKNEKVLKKDIINPKLQALRNDYSKVKQPSNWKRRVNTNPPKGVNVPRNKCFTPQVNKYGKSACLVSTVVEDEKIDYEDSQDSVSFKMDEMAVSIVERMMNDSKEEFMMESKCKLSFTEEEDKSNPEGEKPDCEQVLLIDLEEDEDKENSFVNNEEEIKDNVYREIEEENLYDSKESDEIDNEGYEEDDRFLEEDLDELDGGDSAVGSNTPDLTPRDGAKCPSPTSSISDKSIESNSLDVDSIIKRAKERLNHSPGPSTNIQGLIGRFEEIRKRAGLQTISFHQESNENEFTQNVDFIQEELITLEKESEELLNSPEMKAKFSTTLF